MFLFKLILLNTFLLFSLITCKELSQDDLNNKNRILFDLADLQTDYLDENSFKQSRTSINNGYEVSFF